LQHPLTDRRDEENLTPLPASPDAGHSHRTIPNRCNHRACPDGFALGEEMLERKKLMDEKSVDDVNVSSEIKQLTDDSTGAKRYARVFAIVEIGLISVVLIGGLLYIFFSSLPIIDGDGYARYINIVDLLNRYSLTSAGTVIPGQAKGVLTRYSLVGPIFAIPLLFIGQKLGRPLAWTGTYNFFVFVIGLLVTYALLRKRVDRGLLRKFFLILAVASMFPGHVPTFYGEVFTAVCVGFGILIVSICASASAGWIAIILGVVNTPATLLGLGLMLLKRILDSKRLRYILLFVAAAGLILGESWLRRGSPFANAYADDSGFRTVMPYSGLPAFSYPFFFGLLSIVFSFGKGLIFFVPGLLLPVGKTLLRIEQQEKLPVYRVYTLWICFLIGMIIVYARWWSWYGGFFWGPRFFLFASIPASFALAIRLHYKDASFVTNLFTLGVLALSVWVAIDGTIMRGVVTNVPICTTNGFELEALCHYMPEFSALWYPFVVHPDLSLEQKVFLAFYLIVFVYLAVPLFTKMVQQCKKPVNKYVREYLNLKIWRL
jgi:hypothetical protein